MRKPISCLCTVDFGCPSNNRPREGTYPLLGLTGVSAHWPLTVTRGGPDPSLTTYFLWYEVSFALYTTQDIF